MDERHDLEVCADCVQAIEYGHVDGCDDWPGILPEWQGWNVVNGRNCPEPFQAGTIIHGTMQPRDVIPALLSECERVGVEIDPEWPAFDDDTGAEIVCEIIEALDGIAPPGFYFGAHYGDGSDFGCWPIEDDRHEFARFTCDCCGRRVDGSRYFATARKA